MVRSQLLNYRTVCKSWMGMFREEVLMTLNTPPQNDKKHGYKLYTYKPSWIGIYMNTAFGDE